MARRSIHHLVVVALLGAGLVTTPALSLPPLELDRANEEIPEELLLDVGIRIFDPGLPEKDESAKEGKAVFPDVRKSEARFIPFHLKGVLESTGQWGAVRVVPKAAGTADVLVTGQILKSTGLILTLNVRVVDARGRVWRDTNYKEEAESLAYADETLETIDPYENLYNLIANDLLKSRNKLKEKEIREIREISRMSFAADLAPDVFGDYLSINKKGKVKILRLPAEDDPMMARVDMIRERDHMFIDTLNEYYADFYLRMDDPYDDWRGISFDEQVALRKIRREARMQKILGGLLLVGAAAAPGSSTGARAARSAAAVSGAVVLQDGIQTGKEAKIHVEALKELAASFDAEMDPLLVEVEGRILRLSGSAEAQYAEWRRLLSQIFAVETGAADPELTAQPTTTGTIKP
jgi:hypothetical protein